MKLNLKIKGRCIAQTFQTPLSRTWLLIFQRTDGAQTWWWSSGGDLFHAATNTQQPLGLPFTPAIW